MSDIEQEVLTAWEVSKLLRVTERMVQMLAKEGEIPAFRVGKYWRFKRDRLEAYMEGLQGCQGSASTEGQKQKSSISDTVMNTESKYADLLARQTRKRQSG